jgi:lipoprotein YgeR
MSLFDSKNLKIILAIFLCLPFVFSSCASTTPSKSGGGSGPVKNYSHTKGSYHTVSKGETLWRISKIYNVPVQVIQEVNRLSGNAIKIGDELLIPAVVGASQVAIGATGAAVGVGVTTARMFTPRLTGSNQFMWPVRGSVMTRFGEVRDDVKTKGIDIATQVNEPIKASRAGRVSFVSESVKGYGKMIIVDHSQGYQTVYAYNSQNLVRKGQSVRQGDVIANAGVSSRTQRPALHFEIRKNHQPLNPQSLLK